MTEKSVVCNINYVKILPQKYGQRFQNGAAVIRLKLTSGGLTAHKLIVTVKLFCYVLHVALPEKRGSLLGMPVSDDAPSAYDYGVKQAVVAVRTRTELILEYMVATLVAEQVFVIRRQQKRLPATASHAAIPVDVVYCAAMLFFHKFVAERIDSRAAFADIQVSPPHKVFKRGGRMATEVFSGEHDNSLLT